MMGTVKNIGTARVRTGLLLLLVSLFVLPVGSFASAPNRTIISLDNKTSVPLVVKPSSKLWLNGDSTLHPFSSTATNAQITVSISSPETQLFTKDFPAAVKKVLNRNMTLKLSLVLPVKNLKSGEGGLDDNLYNTLKASKFSNILFELKDYQVVSYAASQETYLIKARGSLTIAGEKRDIVLEPKVHFSKSDGVKISGEQEILMTEYNIQPPTIFMVIKVANKILVNYSLEVGISPEKIKNDAGGA